jgi:CRISPR type III-A-associated protein Csm2
MVDRQRLSPSQIVEKFLRGGTKEKKEVILGNNGKSELEAFAETLQGLSFTKLRKYYEQFLNIYEGWQAEGKRGKEEPLSEEFLLKLYMLKSLLTYDIARAMKNEKKALKALENLKEFVERMVNLIEKSEDLESSKYLFEALVGYARFKLEEAKKKHR